MAKRALIKAARYIREFTARPGINLFVGLLLVASGIAELWQIAYTELQGPHFGAHHGAIIFGLFQVAKSFPDLFEGLEYVQKGGEES